MCLAPCEQPDWFPLRWQLDDAPAGLQGRSPLPWWGAGWYAAERRERILALRRSPDPRALAALIAPWLQRLEQQPWPQQLQLVPIPSGQAQANPVPQLLAEGLQRGLWSATPVRIRPELLLRRQRLAAQHRLGRGQRWRNQWLSFQALLVAADESNRVLLVDDVLTSGATALAAQQALQAAGWVVDGLLCLARTPRPGRGRA